MDEETLFSRQVPFNINPAQRMAIEGLAVAAYLILAAYRRIQWTVSGGEISDEGCDLNHNQRLEICTDVWSIVDRADAIRQLLHYQKEYILFSPSDEQSTSIGVASKMRNAMDHPKGTIDRLRQKKRLLPIFGVVGFEWLGDGDLVKDDEGYVFKARNFTIISVSGIHGQFNINLGEVLTSQLHVPFGNVNLWAFDQRLPVDHLASLARDLLNHLDQTTSHFAKKGIDALGETIVPIPSDFCETVRETMNVEERLPKGNFNTRSF